MKEWNYISNKNKSNGYETVIDILKSYKPFKKLELSDEEKEAKIKEVFNIYRNINIYPIMYYNEDGIIEEIIKCVNKEVSFNGNVLNLKFNQGQSLCRFLFPNLATINCGNTTNNSPYEKFYDDYKLEKAISFCLKHKTTNTPVTPSGVKDGLEMLGGNVATNFKSMNAKALYERYCPNNGIIYDFSCGFGGRMLGALSSKKNYKYFGVEPCYETFTHLNELGKYIETATNRKNIFKIYCIGSEDYKCKDNYVDFAFSSPPYFSLEKYSDEDTQCYNKFPTLEERFIGYVEPTIKNIYSMLKKDSYYAVNIADFNIGNKRVEYVDRWIEISKKIGFEYIERISMKLETRRGNGHKDNKNKKKEKQEGIFVFKKIS